jgi:hypothetical protein
MVKTKNRKNHFAMKTQIYLAAQKADIQKASRVGSAKGLKLHVYGQLVAAFITLIFNS